VKLTKTAVLKLTPSDVAEETHGSCAGLEFSVRLGKSLNFSKLKNTLNCFGKRVEGLEKFGICLL